LAVHNVSGAPSFLRLWRTFRHRHGHPFLLALSAVSLK
jgi:hypothetical protein